MAGLRQAKPQQRPDVARFPTSGLGLALGPDGKIPGILVNGAVGSEIAYSENTTTSTNVTATTEAAALTYITSPSFTSNGTSAVLVTIGVPVLDTPASAGQNIYLELLESTDGAVAVSRGNFARIASPTAAVMRLSVERSRRFVPLRGTTILYLQSWVDSGTGVLRAGNGSLGVDQPAFMRVTRVTGSTT